MRIGEILGTGLGGVLSPVVALASAFRRARVFHPTGWTYGGRVTAVARDGAMGEAASRLEGGATVRMSTGIAKELGSRPDIHGCAVRFREAGPASTDATASDQDLMTATFRDLNKAGAGMKYTDLTDFLANEYYAITPFEIDGVGAVKLRLMPKAPSPEGDGAVERLDRAVAGGTAAFVFEARPEPRGEWTPLVEIALEERVDLDQRRLRYHPFRNGRGIRPTGWINALRRAAYPASQVGRP